MKRKARNACSVCPYAVGLRCKLKPDHTESSSAVHTGSGFHAGRSFQHPNGLGPERFVRARTQPEAQHPNGLPNPKPEKRESASMLMPLPEKYSVGQFRSRSNRHRTKTVIEQKGVTSMTSVRFLPSMQVSAIGTS